MRENERDRDRAVLLKDGILLTKVKLMMLSNAC